jgi:hypothetical protein
MTKFKLIFNLGFLKEAISSFIPTSIAYVETFNQVFTQNQAIALAVLTFLVLFLILIFAKISEYKRSVSRALANGYFRNFAEKLVHMCVSKGKNKIRFFFEDKTLEFSPEQISIKIFLEESQSKLKNKNEEIKKVANIAYVDKDAFNYPFFVWAKVERDKLFVYDIPRTLLSLKDYVAPDLEGDEDLDKETRTFYKKFNSEFRKLWTRLDKGGLHITIE